MTIDTKDNLTDIVEDLPNFDKESDGDLDDMEVTDIDDETVTLGEEPTEISQK